MPRLLILFFLVAAFFAASMVGSSYASPSDVSTKIKEPIKGSIDQLASVLKTASKKSSGSKFTSSSKKSKFKSAYHKSKGSKKFTAGKKTKKHAIYKHKPHRKYKGRTKTARKSL